MAAFLVQLGIYPGLPIFANLYCGRVPIITPQAKHQIVLPGCQRQGKWSLTTLLVAVNEYIRSSGIGADEDALGQRLQLNSLIERSAGIQLQDGLQWLKPGLKHLQVVSSWRQATE